LVSKDKHFN